MKMFEVSPLENLLPGSPMSITNAIWDQSAKIFAAVIDNPGMLPDDMENPTGAGSSDYNDNHHDTRNLKRTKKTKRVPLTGAALARLQEEHALWLK
ncbi:MAG: hypothetical protein R6W75_06415 [Smithellaceae bacterium]